MSVPFICKPTIPGSVPHHFHQALKLRATIPLHSPPKTRYQRARICSYSLLNLFQLTNPKPTYSTASILFHGNYKQSFVSLFSSQFLCFLMDSDAFPCGPEEHGMPPSPGIREHNNLSFQLHLFPDLLALLCPYINKTYIKTIETKCFLLTSNFQLLSWYVECIKCYIYILVSEMWILTLI